MLLCTGYISVGEIIGILAAEQAHLVGLHGISVAVDANALQNAVIAALWQHVATDTLVDKNVIICSGRLAGSVVIDVLSRCQLLTFWLTPSATAT